MSSDSLQIFIYSVFGASIGLIIYIVYYEWKSVKIRAERDEIEMGEMKIEDDVNSLSDTGLVDSINKDVSRSAPIPPTTKKPT